MTPTEDDMVLAEAAAQDRMDLQSVLRTVEGRRFIRRLLTEAGLYDFTQSGLEVGALAYTAGRRDFGLLIVSMVTSVDPRAFAQLTNEAALETERLQSTYKGDPNA
jgi:hypothetical protein